MKTVFVRPELCIGCRHCEVACAVEHAENKNILGAVTEKKKSQPRIFVETGPGYKTFPNRCRHCDPAPCMQVCPTGALVRDNASGSVGMAYARCIGCAVCAMACPFGIIRFGPVRQLDTDREVNAKCDNCLERQKEGLIPACAWACKTGALEFGDANDLVRTSRKDFTTRLVLAEGKGAEVTALPPNIRAFRAIMEELAGL
ncbi:4Fe-4S dicluster domain-containing protein [Methanoregula sp.]|uniref:4Fe-4S dicluster domain-containing protein n=1 Tax=Methanoregula sp. TaxID=2052170 RepID=UPI0026092297|nr:4Fe-4S dicluster domain-containing protein [Methanoregula sp.]MDD5143548.1 4Fe-4S dicluster domain-containing protein [Methanoregula sp.]